MLTLKWNAPSNAFTSVSANGIGMEPPTLLTTMSSRPNSSTAVSTRPATASRSERSAGTTTARAATLLHLRGDVVELVGGAGGDHDVGAGLGQGERRGGPDAAPGGGDDGDTVVETEAVEQHAGTLPGRYVARMTVPVVDDQPTPEQLDALYSALSNWGRWGADDELGALELPHSRAPGARRARWCAPASP